MSFFLYEERLTVLTQDLINDRQSLIIVALILFSLLAADVVLPTPSSIISIAAAVYFGFWGGALIIFAGMSACCLFGYYLGYTGHALAHKQLLGHEKDQQRIQRWSQRWGKWSLLLARPVPVLAETSVVLAGVVSLPLKGFLLYTLPANAVIAIIYASSAFLSF